MSKNKPAAEPVAPVAVESVAPVAPAVAVEVATPVVLDDVLQAIADLTTHAIDSAPVNSKIVVTDSRVAFLATAETPGVRGETTKLADGDPFTRLAPGTRVVRGADALHATAPDGETTFEASAATAKELLPILVKQVRGGKE